MSSAGIVPPTVTSDVVGALLAQQLDDARDERHVRAGEDRQADRVGVLLDHGLDDLLRRLVQAGVDDLHAGVAQRAGDDLRAAVVTVQAGLGDDDADLLLAAGARSCAGAARDACRSESARKRSVRAVAPPGGARWRRPDRARRPCYLSGTFDAASCAGWIVQTIV